MAQEHSHDHAYLHEHNIPHLHHETDVHDADHNHEHAHSHDHAEGHGHVHENTQAVLNRLSRAIGHLEGDPAGPYPALHRRCRGARRRAGARRAVSGDRQIREITARVYLKTSNVTGSEEFSR